jgi:DNA-binding response OmpR family regulator
MSIILIIENESELVRVLCSYLEKTGMNVLVSSRGDTGLSLWEKSNLDLAILDLGLPGMDGLDIAYEIRRRGSTPIIMVTARVEEEDRLMGLEIGADDYVTKPYSPREVVARVKVVLRRVGFVNCSRISLDSWRWSYGCKPS